MTRIPMAVLMVLCSVAQAQADAPVEVVPELFATDIPTLTDADTGALQPYLNTRRARFASWLPQGGGMLVSTRFGQTDQIHQVNAPLGARTQLTFEAEPIRSALAASWRGKAGFFYLKDIGGGEGYQLFFFDRDAGRHTRLTDPPSRNVGVTLSTDRGWLAFASTRRNLKDYDIYVMDLARDAAPRKVRDNAGYWVPTDWSPDNRSLLLLNYVSSTEASVHRLSVDKGTISAVAPNPTPMTFTGSGRFSHDGRGAYLVSNRWGQFRELGYWDFESAQLQRLTADIPWDVESFAVAPSGRCLALSINQGGRSRLRLWRLPERTPIDVPDLPMGTLGQLAFDPEGPRLALSFSGPRTAGDVYVVSLTGKQATLTPWTGSEVGGLDTQRFIEPTLMDFETFDTVEGGRRRIPAFYYRPPGEGPFPVIVVIHGGPESQWRPRFSAVYQHWARDLGAAVIAPNVRGSAGYGKDYLLLDNGVRREDSVKDIGALLDWIATRDELDATRVGVFGGSYGGYMVLASMAHYADRLRAGAEIVGISNFVTFLENTKPYRRDLRRAEYGDERDPKMRAHLTSISPTQLVGKIRDPLFVAQGQNDPRVPVGESTQIVQAVQSRGVPTWYLLAMDEGHGFRKKKNRDYYYAALTRFWRTHLMGLGGGSP